MSLQIARVTLHARLPVGALGYTPGWRAAQMVEVLLEPEDPQAMPAALQAGWKPTKD